MIICPNCSSVDFSDLSGVCTSCHWQRKEHQGVREYFTDADRASDMISDYVDNYEELAQINIEKSNIDRRFLRNQAANLVRYISPVAGKRVCDVGIGQGFLCDELLRANAASVTAVDVSVSYLRRFGDHEKVTPYLANAKALPFCNEFDLMVSTDVIEHVINVGSFLYCANRSLVHGGMLAVRVPCREGLLEYSPHRGYAHSFGHLRSFNKDILRIYLRQAGFRTRSFHLDGFSTGTPHPWLYGTNRKKRFYNGIANYLNKKLEHPADATLMNSFWAGIVMRPAEVVVVAEKISELG